MVNAVKEIIEARLHELKVYKVPGPRRDCSLLVGHF